MKQLIMVSLFFIGCVIQVPQVNPYNESSVYSSIIAIRDPGNMKTFFYGPKIQNGNEYIFLYAIKIDSSPSTIYAIGNTKDYEATSRNELLEHEETGFKGIPGPYITAFLARVH